MKVVWTEDALRDLAEITAYLAIHHPGAGERVEGRIRELVD